MSTATFGSSRTTRSRESSGLGVGGWLALAAVLALLGFLVAWVLGWIRFTTDPRLVEVRQLQEKAQAAYGSGPATMAEATAAIDAMREIREKTEALPPHLRAAAERQGGNQMGSMFRQRIDAYFAAPPAQRRAEIDRQIDQEELMRKAREASSPAAPTAGQGNGQAARGGASAAPGGPGRGSEESRNRFVKSIIDRTTPEQRARYVEYRRVMEERREQRGLPNSGWGR